MGFRSRGVVIATTFLLLTACGGQNGNSSGSSSSSNSSSSSASSSASSGTPLVFQVNAGADLRVTNSAWVPLKGTVTASTGSLPSVQWRQISGPTVSLTNTNDPLSGFVAPDVRQTTDLIFELRANVAGQERSDTVNITVEPCNPAADVLFDECIAPGFGPWLSYESSDRSGQFFHYEGQGNYHVQWQEVDSGDSRRGKVMEVRWNANDPNHQQNARGWFGLALPGSAGLQGTDMSAYANGALSFDMRLVYHGQPGSAAPFIFKMECVHPCVSAEMPIRNGHTSYDWQTHTYPVRELVASGLNLAKLNHVFVIQPDWFNQEQDVTVQIDNIRLTKTYTPPEPENGCTGRGNVTYTLARAANPTADQQEAYGLITAAMDTAVKNYNCYTNLSRHLQVSYNPSVQTADGNINGAIRFGSRASMHHVTAMHEIAHVFGVGFAQFKALIQNGVFTGPITTAKAREISGNPNEQIKTDGTHFWPYGLNYISEGRTQQDLINHCLIVQAIVADLGG
jgi:hypothetical protein